MARKVLVQIRRGLESNMGVLAVGELGYCTDTTKLYIGGASGNVLLVAAQTAGDMLKSIYDTNNDGKVDYAATADAVPWGGVSGKPGSYPPAAHEHSQLLKLDDRDVKPVDTGKGVLSAYFASLGGLTGAADSDYQDLLVLNTYTDVSGGAVNALSFDKSEMSIKHFQAVQSASSWGVAKTLAYTGDVMPKGPLTWGQLKGG
jgi:hypothetical protein